MADDKTTKTPEQPVTDSGPGKETPPAPPKADKDKAAAPKPKTPAQKPENAVKKEPEKKTAPTVQTAPAPKGPEKPKDAPRLQEPSL